LKKRKRQDRIYDKALKLVQMDPKELGAMEPLLEMVLLDSAKEQSQKDDDDDTRGVGIVDNNGIPLAGSFVTNIVENENWIFDLLLNTTLDAFRMDTEQKILSRLQSSSSNTTNSSVGGDRMMNVTMDNIRTVAKVVTEDSHGRIRDAVRKAVALTYVEVVNRLDGSRERLQKMETSSVANQPTTEDATSTASTSATTTATATTPIATTTITTTTTPLDENEQKWKEKYEEKIQAMMQEHEAFVANLVEEHEKREELLMNQMEAQKVLHSRMVDNCLIASSNAVKMVRESIV
jgi:hypothetical protein